MNRIGYCNRIFCLSQLCECKQIMVCTVLTERVEHQGPAICQGSDLVALITSRPHKTMELVFIFQIFLTRNGMRRDRESSEAMLTDYWKQTQEMFPSTYFSTERRLLATSPIPILHDRSLQMIFYHSQLSLVASLLCFPNVLGLFCSFPA